MRKELLAPAGSFEKLKTAIHYGADALYLGGEGYSLRANAGAFGPDLLAASVSYAHERGVSVYVTVNIFAKDQDFVNLDSYLLLLEKIGVDGVIVADPGIFSVIRRIVPALPVHISTQANITNSESALFWADLGADRVNLARELSVGEISSVKAGLAAADSPLKLEVFVHGAICISYSGRCLLSRYLTGRDANQGDCAHPCRYSYALVEEKRAGQFFPIEEDGRGAYIMNSKDLCLLRRLPQLFAAGVDSFKIEGRMKSVFYVGGVVRVYRAAIDFIDMAVRAGALFHEIQLPEECIAEIEKIGTRGFTENFADGEPRASEMLYTAPRLSPDAVPAAIVRRVVSATQLTVAVRNPIDTGESLTYLGPGLASETVQIARLVTEMEPVDRAHPGTEVLLETERPFSAMIEENGLFRKVELHTR